MNKTIVIALLLALIAATVLTGCSGNSGGHAAAADPLKDYPASDMSGYEGLSGYDKELTFVDVTMEDVKALMDAKSTFVLYAGFNTCPWCNVLISYLNDAALDAGQKLAYLDTRRDPAWQSNVDIDGYDIFVEYFGDYLEEDADGLPHLYVPDLYFIKDGQVVNRRDGVVPGLDSPTDVMTEELKSDLTSSLKECFDSLK